MSPNSSRHLRAIPRDDESGTHDGGTADRDDRPEPTRIGPSGIGAAPFADDDAEQWADEVLTQLAPWTMGPHLALRIALALAALIQLAVALPWLVAADPAGLMDGATEAHLTRDGALGLAVAVAAGLTVWRPRYAIAASLVGFAIVTAQLITAIVDDHFQRVSLRAELAHGWTVVIVLMLALCARPRRGPRTHRRPPTSHR